ncbi:MAG: ferrochelatase [Alphaproteobacteria bacterium]|nr:ferrochelatase [Alphaproteobacteria bacterium]
MKVAVLLLNFGGPENPRETFFYLYRLFSDPCVFRIPASLRQTLALVLALFRTRKTKQLYAHIGGRSPVYAHTKEQARALEERLAGMQNTVRCFVAMRYSRPFIRDACAEIKAWRPDKIVFLPLYPQFSTVTTGSGWRELKQVFSGERDIIIVPDYPCEPGFISALAQKTGEIYKEAARHGTPRVLFSAHGLPETIVRRGDPYPRQCKHTAEALAEALAIPGLDWGLCYQSRAGPFRWTGPSLEEEIKKAADKKQPVLVVPISFAAENLETLVELDRDGKALALSAGAPYFARAPAAGTEKAFIDGLARLVGAALKQAPEGQRQFYG